MPKYTICVSRYLTGDTDYLVESWDRTITASSERKGLSKVLTELGLSDIVIDAVHVSRNDDDFGKFFYLYGYSPFIPRARRVIGHARILEV